MLFHANVNLCLAICQYRPSLIFNQFIAPTLFTQNKKKYLQYTHYTHIFNIQERKESKVSCTYLERKTYNKMGRKLKGKRRILVKRQRKRNEKESTKRDI